MSTIRLFYGRDSAEMKAKLEAALEGNTHVSTLEVRETVLEDEVIDAIVNLIWKGNVETVQLDDCGAYMNKQAIQMARALGNCKHVRLSEPTFLSKFFLESFLSSATKLESLRIQDRLLVDQVQALAKGLKSNNTLHTLDLSRSRIDDVSVLAEGLRENTSLKCIKLRSIGMNDEQMETIVSSLYGHPTLESLDLSFNHLRDLTPLGHVLKCPNCKLNELTIGFQNMWQIAKTNTSSLAEALKENESLVTLGMAANKLTDQDANEIAHALAINHNLENLDVRENRMHDEGIISLAMVAKKSKALRKLFVVKNPFCTNASLALLDAARSNHNIIHVDVCCKDSINQKIRYNAVLNRGGRRLLLERPPLALWPLAMERANNIDWTEDNTTQLGQQNGALADPRIDVLYYFLQKGPPIFEGLICGS
jgi:Ran GTPase-activating protein (RanGAP) involved in mRNA processing and transport